VDKLEHIIKTNKSDEMINITDIVENDIRESGIEEGLVTVFVPHTTAGVTINENADPDVVHDILEGLRRAFPEDRGYLHREGNSHAHIKASVIGSSCTVIIEKGRMKLGIWQGIYFCEFDGPRTRKFFVKMY
jgi:secondary thiamine-phosphate synthase enzyme